MIITKEKRKKFYINISNYILSIQNTIVEEDNNVFIRFRVPTKSTFLTITLYKENNYDICYSVFMRYDKPSYNIDNSYSGKYNFHAGNNDSNVVYIINQYKTFLNNAININ